MKRVWTRVQNFAAKTKQKNLVLRPKQEQLLHDHKSITSREIWDALAVSKQGALDLLRPLIQAGLVKRIGTQKTGRSLRFNRCSVESSLGLNT
jgi:DNA-binding MarR family transcriptional regulator